MPDGPGADGRRSEILSAAAALFAARGVEATSVREIGDGVGLNPGALYHYFPSKGAIANELITRYLEELAADYEARGLGDLDPRSRLAAIVDVSLATGASRPNATKVYHAEFAQLRKLRGYERARELSSAIQRMWLDAIEAGRSSGVLRSDVPAKVFHRFLRDSVWFSVYWREDGQYTVDQLREYCLAVFLDGMARPLS